VDFGCCRIEIKALYNETFEKCFPLLAGFKFKEGVPLLAGLTTPYDLPDLPQYHLPELRGRRGRHEYIEYFEDKAKASLRAKC